MNIGQYKNRITFAKEETTVSARGTATTALTDVKSVWSRLNNLFGREFYSAMRENLENTVIFDVRYQADIEGYIQELQKYRIKFNGRIFRIIHIDNVLYKNETLKIKALELI